MRRSAPYQIAEATTIGGIARAGLSRVTPANTGTTARKPGRKRARKMATTPQRL